MKSGRDTDKQQAHQQISSFMESYPSDDEAQSFLPKPQGKSLGHTAWITRVSLILNACFAVGVLVFVTRAPRLPQCSGGGYCMCCTLRSVLLTVVPQPRPKTQSVTLPSSFTTHQCLPPRNTEVLAQRLIKPGTHFMTVCRMWFIVCASSSTHPAGPSILTDDEVKKLPNWTQPLMVAGQETYSTLVSVDLYVKELHVEPSLAVCLSRSSLSRKSISAPSSMSESSL